MTLFHDPALSQEDSVELPIKVICWAMIWVQPPLAVELPLNWIDEAGR
jgi:hypothetical protein